MRQIGSDTKYPTGASPGSFGGDDPSIAREDHIHSLWHKWEELDLSTGWIPNGSFWLSTLNAYSGLRVSKAANLIEVNGIIEFDGDATIDTAPNLIGTLPEGCRPDEDIVVSCYGVIPFPLIVAIPTYILINVGSDGKLEYLDNTITISPMNIYIIMFMNFIFRTDYA